MKYLLYFTLPFYILDQVTKGWIVSRFPDPREVAYSREHDITVIPGFFDIVRVHNTGMAFGLLNGTAFANYLFLGIAAVATGFIIRLWKQNMFPTPLTKISVALLLSGIFGNVTDRLLPGRGYVVDFLHFYIGRHAWPSFNVADACICVAAGLLMYGTFKAEQENNESGKKQEA